MPEAERSRFVPPERFNIADYFLDDRLREGRGAKVALVTDSGRLTYAEVRDLANRFGNVLRSLGIVPEQRVIVALPDSPEFVGALFGIVKVGAVAVMLNPHLSGAEIASFLSYTGAACAVVHADNVDAFAAAAAQAPRPARLLVVGGRGAGHASFEDLRARASAELAHEPTHRDDPAIWLFSGGTTGRPKAVVQTHRSFANTTECYAKRWIGYRESDVTLSVPKLYFGYATGSNLFFPFSVGATACLFPERCTPEALFARIRAWRPTILVHVPTMVAQMVGHPDAPRQDLSCLRLATSAGEALPVELHRRWRETFGVELLDGLGTAEMWHIFISNRPGDARPGTIGRVVPGFDVRVCDDEGGDLPPGEVGTLWVRGGSRAIGYWRLMEKTEAAFRGEWYVTGDLVRRDAEGYFTHCGRGDDMLKVSGKWLSPAELESCLLAHPAVEECAVVGFSDAAGLVRPRAFVVARERRPGLDEELRDLVARTLAPYKAPREVVFLDRLPRTHLGKVDRARLKQPPAPVPS